MSKIYFAIIETYYQIYAYGTTAEMAKENAAKGYRKTYPKKDRSPETTHGTVQELDDWFGIRVYEIDSAVGWTHE